MGNSGPEREQGKLSSGSGSYSGDRTTSGPVLQLPGSGNLGKPFVSLSLSFPICKLRVVMGMK